MFRFIARACIVLLVAGVVAGGFYVAVPRDRPTNAAHGVDRPDTSEFGARPEHRGRPGARRGDRDGHHGGREDGSVGHGLAGVAGTTLQIACVGAVVVGLQKRSQRRRRECRAENVERLR
jgi:hypothetical protein